MYRYSLMVMLSLCSAGNAAAGWADTMLRNCLAISAPCRRADAEPLYFAVDQQVQYACSHLPGPRLLRLCHRQRSCHRPPAGAEHIVVVQWTTSRFFGSKSVTVYVQFDRPNGRKSRSSVQANSRDDVTISPIRWPLDRLSAAKPGLGSDCHFPWATHDANRGSAQ